jgi:hypothetical protein
MSKADEYLDNAAETVDLANKASSSADKGRLLRLAEKWLALAERAHHLRKRQRHATVEHPLVTRALSKNRWEGE